MSKSKKKKRKQKDEPDFDICILTLEDRLVREFPIPPEVAETILFAQVPIKTVNVKRMTESKIRDNVLLKELKQPDTFALHFGFDVYILPIKFRITSETISKEDEQGDQNDK